MKKIEFDSEYGRTGFIWMELSPCHVCGEKSMCLNIDSSEDEYGPGIICKKCVEKMFDEASE